jgi:hypothetical protein
MAVQASITLTSGNLVQALNYRLDPGALQTNIVALTAAMAGGSQWGSYHARGPLGWIDIPASQVQAVVYTPPLRAS